MYLYCVPFLCAAVSGAAFIFLCSPIAYCSLLTLQLGLEIELIQTQMTQKPMLRAEVGMRVRCANKARAECIMRGRGIGQNSRKNCQKARHLWVARTPQKQ